MFFLKELPTKQMLERMHNRIPEMDMDTVGKALKMMRQASILLRELESYFSRHDFSQLRFLILMVIYREEKPLLIGDIASNVDVSKPVMTRTLASLEAEGLIRFEKRLEDRRAKQVVLTCDGEQKLLKILPNYYVLIENFMKKWEGQNG